MKSNFNFEESQSASVKSILSNEDFIIDDDDDDANGDGLNANGDNETTSNESTETHPGDDSNDTEVDDLADDVKDLVVDPNEKKKRGPGRPKGSKNKSKSVGSKRDSKQ